jgi:hypothetical protein
MFDEAKFLLPKTFTAALVRTLHKARTFLVHSLQTFDQGDRIERVFAHWVIVYFGQRFENYSR